MYIADIEAKGLMNRSKVIKRKLIALFGEEAYTKDGKVNRSFLSDAVFNEKKLLDAINSIVHPKVASHFKRWLKKQDAVYVIKEAAIIFEHKKQSEYDYIITVVADKELRIDRLLNRDAKNREQILRIMDNQLSDEKKIELSDYVIYNDELEETEKQVMEIHQNLLDIAAQAQF